MSLIELDSLQLFRGKPLVLEDICVVYAPTLDDIADIGMEQFYQYISVLTIDKAEAFPDAEEVNEIIYLIALFMSEPSMSELIKKAFFFFTKEDVTILPELGMIQLGELSEGRILEQEQFLFLQKHIRRICVVGQSKLAEQSTDSERVRKIKEKIRRGQALVEKIKKDRGEGEEPLEMVDLVSSYLAKANGVDIDNVWNMPYYMFQTQFRRMQMVEQYETNLKASLAGAKIPKDEMKHWIGKIQET